MDIQKYGGFFHDGIVFDIEHHNDSMKISMESCELYDEWNTENIPLSKRKTICGDLYLEGIEEIKINDQTFKGILIKTYDEGDIRDLDLKLNQLILQVSWENYPPKEPEETGVFDIRILADKIHWVNIPNCFDHLWKS